MNQATYQFKDLLYWIPEEVADALLTGQVNLGKPRQEGIGPPCSYFYYVVFRDGSAKIMSGMDWYVIMYRALLIGEIDDVNIKPTIQTADEQDKVKKGFIKLGITEEMVKNVKPAEPRQP